MKHTYRSIFSLLVVLLCFVSLAMPIYASGASDTLMQRGYPEEYIGSLNDAQKDTLEAIAEENDLVYLGTKLISDENQGVGLTLVYSGVLREENGTSYIDRVFVTVDYQWKSIPAERNRDTITVHFETPELRVGSYFMSTDYMQRAKDGEWVNGKTTDAPHLRSEKDITYHVNIKFNGTKTEKMAALQGTAYFDLIPTALVEYDPDSGFALDVNAYYNHMTSGSSILESQGAGTAAKWLLLIVGVFAVFVAIGLFWEKLWNAESKAVRIVAVMFALIAMVYAIFRFGLVGVIMSALAAFFLYDRIKK